MALAGCATYAPEPLPDHATLASGLDALRHDGVVLGGPLSVRDVTLLVLQNNPDLLAARAQHGVAQAQVIQAGMPPNPQVNGAILPLAAGVGTTQAWNAGISYDLKSLVTLRRRRASARDAALQVDASLLWQEWQTIGQARLLVVDIMLGEQGRRQLTEALDATQQRSIASQRALAAGNATLSAIAPDLAAQQTARAGLDDLARQQLMRRHQLAALLGLLPAVDLPLAAQPDLPPFDPAAARADLDSLAQRRPDLIALRFGYQAQDQKLRAAILAQFPNLTLGVTGGSDNANVRNVGPSITFELPLFDRNQGNIAIERATRGQLHAEYTARIAAADGQVRAMLDEISQLDAQLAAKRAERPLLVRNAARAAAAFASGDLDIRSYVDFITARTAKDQEILTLQQTLLDQQVAIATLIGAGMPEIAPQTAPFGDTAP